MKTKTLVAILGILILSSFVKIDTEQLSATEGVNADFTSYVVWSGETGKGTINVPASYGTVPNSNYVTFPIAATDVTVVNNLITFTLSKTEWERAGSPASAPGVIMTSANTTYSYTLYY